MNKIKFNSDTEFDSYLKENKPREIWLDIFSEKIPYIIIMKYCSDKYYGVYHTQGVMLCGSQEDYKCLFQEGIYIKS